MLRHSYFFYPVFQNLLEFLQRWIILDQAVSSEQITESKVRCSIYLNHLVLCSLITRRIHGLHSRNLPWFGEPTSKNTPEWLWVGSTRPFYYYVPFQRMHMLKPPFKSQQKQFVCEELQFRKSASVIWERDLNSLNQIAQSIGTCCLFSVKEEWLWIMIVFILSDYFYYIIPLQEMVPKGLLNFLKSISRPHQWNE